MWAPLTSSSGGGEVGGYVAGGWCSYCDYRNYRGKQTKDDRNTSYSGASSHPPIKLNDTKFEEEEGGMSQSMWLQSDLNSVMLESRTHGKLLVTDVLNFAD